MWVGRGKNLEDLCEEKNMIKISLNLKIVLNNNKKFLNSFYSPG